jgi:hypothetical protein
MRDDGGALLNIAKKLGAAVLPLTSQVANDAIRPIRSSIDSKFVDRPPRGPPRGPLLRRKLSLALLECKTQSARVRQVVGDLRRICPGRVYRSHMGGNLRIATFVVAADVVSSAGPRSPAHPGTPGPASAHSGPDARARERIEGATRRDR